MKIPTRTVKYAKNSVVLNEAFVSVERRTPIVWAPSVR
jgi:hypothetical protein